METQNKIIQKIVSAVSTEKHVEKIIFFEDYLVNGMPHEITLIIYESCEPNYIITQEKYEKLLKNIQVNIPINILAVNSEDALRSLDKRLENSQCIYDKKAKK